MALVAVTFSGKNSEPQKPMSVHVTSGKKTYCFDSIKQAYDICSKSDQIAIISFCDTDGDHTFITHIKGGSDETIEIHLNKVSEAYSVAKEGDLFWTDEIMCPPEWINKTPSTQEEKDRFCLACIKMIVSDALFKSKYNCQ